MRLINGVIYSVLLVLFLCWVRTGKKTEVSGLEQYIRKHGVILVWLFVINTISFGMTFRQEEGVIYIQKSGYGGEETQTDFVLTLPEEERQVSLTVRPRTLTEEECRKKWQEAFQYLEEHIPGENESLLLVTKPLDFSIDHETYPFDVEVQPEDIVLMDSEGNLKNERKELLAAGYGEAELEQGIATSVTVILWYGTACEKKVYALRLFPKTQNEQEEQFTRAEAYLREQEQNALYDEGFTVDSQVDKVGIRRIGQSGVTPLGVLVMGGLFIGLLLLREQEAAKNEEKQRRECLLQCYPWFVNELVLLLGAGMQVKNIFGILLMEYGQEQTESGRSRRTKGQRNYREPLMQELMVAVRSMKLGMSEEQAYYQLGRRLRLPCYTKLMLLLEQNVRKGAKGLTIALEQEELAALEERKNLAKRYGEEAGTKLLGPMLLLLLVVMSMILIPAFLSFSV